MWQLLAVGFEAVGAEKDFDKDVTGGGELSVSRISRYHLVLPSRIGGCGAMKEQSRHLRQEYAAALIVDGFQMEWKI